ncbi:MAG: UDP-N-acetylmuramoyl-L-alanine--D-glutamate ligase [Gammaproteobacteria bacterium]|nr:UDP-N-acetylmuramoyl-L-alanine--D-glutamate ligase [Gammaproteobacteria bacterium]
MQVQYSQQRPRTLIVGLGKTGVSCARFLAGHGVEVAVTDSREQPPGLTELHTLVPEAAVFLGGFSEEALKRADQVVLSPGVAANTPFVARARGLGLPVFGDIELFARQAKAPVVAVTGSNGKSTVTTLVGRMAERAGLEVRVGGNLGTPALDLIRDREPQLYVLELSSFQLEITSSLQCVAATVLNVSPDHLDRYATFADYAAAKARIYNHCDTAVVNRDDALVNGMPQPGQKRVSFGLQAPQHRDYGVITRAGERWLAHGGQALLRAGELLIHGEHNLSNALAALALAEAAGMPVAATLEALRSFPGLPHRMQHVATIHEVDYYDDSKGTNLGATLAAVSGLSGPLVLIAGGDGKHQDFTALAPALKGKARAVVLLGKDADTIAAVLKGKLPVQSVKDMQSAVRTAASLARPGDLVLLSPACSSLDMFENFEHRGRMFAQAVRGLADG